MSLRKKTASTWVLTAAGLGMLMVLFLADAGLLVICLLPLVLAAICTLGTLGLMGHFPDERAWLLALPALGLWTAFPLCIIRAWQRYQCIDHADFKATIAAAVLGAGLVMAGFGILTGTGRELVRTAGWISFLVSAYGLAGTLLILPALLRRRVEASQTAGESIFGRYSNMTPLPRLAIRCRQRRDPVLDELATLVPQQTDMANILDVGCGYGLPACWLAERYPSAIVHGIDPNAERVRVAAMALNERGRVVEGAAPDLPPMDVLVDMAILIDTSHCLQDWELEKTLVRIHERLLPGGRLILRTILPEAAISRWSRYREWFARSGQAHKTAYRNAHELGAILSACGFQVLTCRTSGRKGRRMWHLVRPN
jgi:SAM-dependent methyltransferase